MNLKNVKTLGQHLIRDGKDFSWSVAWGRLMRDLPVLPWEKRKRIYDRSILRYLEKHYLKYIEASEQTITETTPGKKRVWIMWWQGVDQMPPIVRACYQQLQEEMDREHRTLTLITQDNWSEYASLPEFIVDKVKSGAISLTHFSDIIRVHLLERYGGCWIDATMYVARLPQEVDEGAFYTLHAPGLFPNFISGGDWSTFFFSCNASDPLMALLGKLFHEYWKDHERTIDYLLFDYLIKIICSHHPETAARISECPVNPHYYALNLSINEAYDPIRFEDTLQKSPLQKLTYKKDFMMYTENRETTNYGYLINQAVEKGCAL